MWISKKKWNAMEKRMTDLEMAVRGQSHMTNLTYEFCKSVANKENLSLLSYQQLYSPSTDSSQKVRMLFEEIRKLGQSTFH